MIEIGINPIAFTIGQVNVSWYSIIVVLAVLIVVLWLLSVVKKRANLSYAVIIQVALAALFFGVIFARLFHVIDLWEYYRHHPVEIIGVSGLAIYGAVLGAALGIGIYSRVRGLPFRYLLDLTAPGIILAQAVGRIGGTLNGCCYGIETRAFFAIVYTHPQSRGPIGVPVHPTQIYEIIYNLIVFAVLLKLRGRFKPDGSLFLIYLSLYSVWRFGIGFLRDGAPFIFGLQEAQIIALIILAIAIPVLAMRTRWVRNEV